MIANRPRLGTFPNGIKPSPPPQIPVPKPQPLDGLTKFAFIYLESLPESQSLIERVKRFLSGKETCCIAVGGCITLKGKFLINLADVVFCEASQAGIIEKLAELQKIYGFQECYSDTETKDWLKAANFWNIYCSENRYSLSLSGKERHKDAAIRQLAIKQPLYDKSLGLSESLRHRKDILSALENPGTSIIADTVAGLVISSLRYR